MSDFKKVTTLLSARSVTKSDLITDVKRLLNGYAFEVSQNDLLAIEKIEQKDHSTFHDAALELATCTDKTTHYLRDAACRALAAHFESDKEAVYSKLKAFVKVEVEKAKKKAKQQTQSVESADPLDALLKKEGVEVEEAPRLASFLNRKT